MSAGAGQKCETCYGEGRIPTDAGLTVCPDCGGAGILATPATLVEWRMRALEEANGGRTDETAQALRWLVFELRRARDALTELVALADDLDDSPERTRIRFVANGALNLYKASDAPPPLPDK
jgi:hypothetical protein